MTQIYKKAKRQKCAVLSLMVEEELLKAFVWGESGKLQKFMSKCSKLLLFSINVLNKLEIKNIMQNLTPETMHAYSKLSPSEFSRAFS